VLAFAQADLAEYEKARGNKLRHARERQCEGIAKAKAEGKYRGRKPLSDVVAKVREMHADKRRPTDIAKALGIGRTSVYRALDVG
jgi:DNA invertase Pin-like site-specific DNA recombinase